MEIHRDQEYVSVPWAFLFFRGGPFPMQPAGDTRLVGAQRDVKKAKRLSSLKAEDVA